MHPTTVLVADADRAWSDHVCQQLYADGYRAEYARSSDHAHLLAGQRPAELVILGDLETPTAAIGLLRAIRADDSPDSAFDPAVAIIVITNRCDDLHRLRCLDAGADDVIAKQVGYPELRARIAAVLRRTTRQTRARAIRVGPLRVDPAARLAWLRDERVELSSVEWQLLAYLARHPTRVHTKRDLLRDIWGMSSDIATRTLDSHACRLRRKLTTQGDHFVINVWGVGYRLIDPDGVLHLMKSNGAAEAVA